MIEHRALTGNMKWKFQKFNGVFIIVCDFSWVSVAPDAMHIVKTYRKDIKNMHCVAPEYEGKMKGWLVKLGHNQDGWENWLLFSALAHKNGHCNYRLVLSMKVLMSSPILFIFFMK